MPGVSSNTLLDQEKGSQSKNKMFQLVDIYLVVFSCLWDLFAIYVICSQFQFEITDVESELWEIFFTIHSPPPGDSQPSLDQKSGKVPILHYSSHNTLHSPAEPNLSWYLVCDCPSLPKQFMSNWLHHQVKLCWWLVMYRAVISLNNALRHLECIRVRSELTATKTSINQSLSFN